MSWGRQIPGRSAPAHGEPRAASPSTARVAQVIVYAHGSVQGLRSSLSSALDSFSGKDVLIVHDGHDEDARDYLTRYAADHDCTLVQNLDTLGFRKSVIKAADIATAEYLVVMDTDVVVTAGGLRELVEELKAGSLADVAVGLLDVQLARWLRSSESDAEIASFLLNANAELVAAAIESCGIADSIACVVCSFTGHPCFAIRRNAFSEHISGEAKSQTEAVPVRLCAVLRCYGRYRSSVIPPTQRPAVDAVDSVVVPPVVDDLRNATSGASWIHELLGKTVLFLLPSPGGGGGANSVVQAVISLRRCGIDARIVNHASNRRPFEQSYPESGRFCSFYSDQDELLDLARDATIVIATSFASVAPLKSIVDRGDPAVVPLYYVQDYEPWFYGPHDPRHAAAKASYTLVPHARAFAKTGWLCRTVRELAGIDVAKIEPSLDRGLHNSLQTRPVARPMPITAMIRPSSGRRNPCGTLSVLRQIRQRHGSAVDIRLFGCPDEELDSLAEAQSFAFVNLGELKPTEVAEVLCGAGIFVDLSSYQAFGSTGLEAMAAGCATVLPRGSGTEEYARDEENCLLVDTATEAEAIAAIERLITDDELMRRIRAGALKTGRNYSARKSTWSLLRLFADSLGLIDEAPAGGGITVAG